MRSPLLRFDCVIYKPIDPIDLAIEIATVLPRTE